MKTPNATFFSSVRTSPQLKHDAISVLQNLGLSWGAFVNNAAKKLVQDQKVTFKVRDAAGFTPEKRQELLDEMKDIKSGKEVTKSMNLEETQEFLRSIS